MMPFTDGWPVRVPRQPDELLSSWFVRTAWANAEKLETFTSRHFGSHSSFWKRDTDRFMDTAILVPLAYKSGLGRKKIFSMMLTPFEGVLYHETQKTSILPWILPLRKMNRDNLGHYVAYCPLCLAEDSEPYFRRFWRLAFAVACPTHGVRLLDACQVCGAPAAYNSIDYGSSASVQALHLAICRGCGVDLRRASPLASPSDPDVSRLTSSLHGIVIEGLPAIDPRDLTSSMLPICYFTGVRWLARWLATRSKDVRLRSAICKQAGIKDLYGYKGRALGLFENRDIGERYVIMRMISWLLKAWPNRFIEIARQAGARRSALINYKMSASLPMWLDEVLRGDLSPRRYVPTDEERAAVGRILEDSGLPHSSYRVDKWLGVKRQRPRFREGQQLRLPFDVRHEWEIFGGRQSGSRPLGAVTKTTITMTERPRPKLDRDNRKAKKPR